MINKRKDEHIKLAREEIIENNDFDYVYIEHDSLPSFNLDDVILETTFLEKKVKYPFYINAMTGGSENAKIINSKLALYAKKFNLPIVVGSQSAALKDENLIDSYKIIRDVYNDAFLVSNVSANATLEQAKRAISMINADALSIHINVIQELVMNEGDRHFSNWSDNIKQIVDNIDKPVLIKEVGFGMSKKTIDKLSSLGVKNIDVSGFGGTNFARIERKRNNDENIIFDNVGISTVDSILNAQGSNLNIHASGGIRNALDIFKALYLGANMVGLSNYFLKLTKLDDNDAIKEIEKLISDLKKCFLMFGYKNIVELKNKPEV